MRRRHCWQVDFDLRLNSCRKSCLAKFRAYRSSLSSYARKQMYRGFQYPKQLQSKHHKIIIMMNSPAMKLSGQSEQWFQVSTQPTRLTPPQKTPWRCLHPDFNSSKKNLIVGGGLGVVTWPHFCWKGGGGGGGTQFVERIQLTWPC